MRSGLKARNNRGKSRSGSTKKSTFLRLLTVESCAAINLILQLLLEVELQKSMKSRGGKLQKRPFGRLKESFSKTIIQLRLIRCLMEDQNGKL